MLTFTRSHDDGSAVAATSSVIGPSSFTAGFRGDRTGRARRCRKRLIQVVSTVQDPHAAGRGNGVSRPCAPVRARGARASERADAWRPPGCENSPARSVRACTVSSPSRQSRSNDIARSRRIGEAAEHGNSALAGMNESINRGVICLSSQDQCALLALSRTLMHDDDHVCFWG
jgi:hypothetical protein